MPVLDMAMLGRIRVLRVPDEPDILGSLIETYLSDSGSVLDALRCAATTGDTAAAVWLARRLKGSSGAVGAIALAQLCGETPSGAADTTGWLTRIEAEYVRATEALRGELANEVEA